MTDPIFVDDPVNQYVLNEIKYPDLWTLYKKQFASFWSVEEVDLSKDKQVFLTLKKGEQDFILSVLAFFAASDGIVNENLITRFMNDVKIKEAQIAYGYQIMMENVHTEMYSLLLKEYAKDREQRDELFNAIHNRPGIKKKADWALKYMKSDASYAKRLMAFACVEGVFFSASFCAIFWIKKRGIALDGLTFSNELISRDEGQHTEFAVAMYHHLADKLTEDEAHALVGDCVAAELEFVKEALDVSLIGMNSDLMSQYVKFVADHLLVSLGYAKLFGNTNPFDFMEAISMEGKANFFEKRVSDYAKAGVMSGADFEFTTDAEF